MLVQRVLVITLGPIKREQLEPIGNGSGFRRRGPGNGHLQSDGRLCGQGRSALVRIEVDFHALVCHARHHAGTRKERVVDRVGGDVGVPVLEADGDDERLRGRGASEG